MTEYYFAADRDSRALTRRKRGAPTLAEECSPLLWWRVDKPTWKAYRAGDIVAIGDWPPEPPRLRPGAERREK